MQKLTIMENLKLMLENKFKNFEFMIRSKR